MVEVPQQPQPQLVFAERYLWKPLRRNVYSVLKPVDKGDFRWEFLVPWVNRSLTTTDKLVVCSTFVGLSFTLQALFDPGASVGVHLSYIAQFFSYSMGDPVGFRTLALLTSVFELAGDLFETKNAGYMKSAGATDWYGTKDWYVVDAEDLVPVVYNLLFLLINSYYILRWVLTRDALLNALEWSAECETLYHDCFRPLGFRRAQFSRLVPYTSIETNEGEESRLLTVQGEPLTDLYVCLTEGSLEVRVSGTLATRLPPYQLVGEASLLENLQSPGGSLQTVARTTIVALPGAKYVRWSQRTFYELQEEDDEFSEAVQLMIARTLSRKLGDARQQTGRRNPPASRGRGGTESGGAEAQAMITRADRWQQREAELEVELAQSKAMASSLRAYFFAFACLVGLVGLSESGVLGSLLGIGS